MASQLLRRQTLRRLVGAAALVAGVLTGGWMLLKSGDGDRDPSLATLVERPTEPLIKLAPGPGPVLLEAPSSEVAGRSNRETDSGASPRASDVRSEKPSDNSRLERAKKKMRAKVRAEREANIEGMKALIKIAPVFEYDSSEDFSPGRTLTMNVLGPLGMSGSVSTLIERGPEVSLGRHIFNANLQFQLKVDHPDAMPLERIVDGREFASHGADYVARPLLQLRPIRSRITLARRPSQALSRSRRPFQGAVKLVRIDARGIVDTLDAKAMGTRGVRSGLMLRMDGPPGKLYVVAIPDDGRKKAGDLADVIQLDATGDPLQAVPTAPRSRQAAIQKFTVVDPYGDTMADVKLSARFVVERAAMFNAKGDPVVVDGHFFYATPGTELSMAFGGQKLVREEIQASPLTLVRGGASDESQGDGTCELRGLTLGPYDYYLRTPLLDTPFHMVEPVDSTAFVHQVMAPVVGLEVLCPVELRGSAKGLEAWSGAKVRIEVKGKHSRKEFPGLQLKTTREVNSPAKGPASPERFHIVPGVPYDVTCEAPGWPPFKATVAKGYRGSIVTALPKADPKDR